MEEKKEGKNKGGRPKKNVTRETNFGFYVTALEKSIIKSKAEQTGLRVADYIREAAIKGKVTAKPTVEQIKAYLDLIGIANNLNQLTKLAHQSGLNAIQTKIVRSLDEVNKTIETMRNDNKDQDR